QDIIDDEVEMSRIRAQSFEELSRERGYEFARAVVKYRNLSSRKQINDVIASLETTEQVYRERLSKETNNVDDLKDRSFDIKDANTSQRDVAVSRINKLLGFDIITETEFAQTEDRTKSSLAKKAEGEQAGRFLYYTRAQDKGDMEVQAIIQAIYDYLDSKQRIAGNYGLKPEEKEKEMAALEVKPVQSLNIGKPENALQLIMLTIIDMIVGQVDRHTGNFMVQPGEDDSMTLKGIDNDTAFGLFDNITGEEGEAKADAYRITPFLSDSLPFVPLSIYEKVKKVDSSMIRGALTGLLSEAEIHFTESRFEKVKAHLEKLVSAHKVQDPTEQNVTELAGRNREGYDQNNYIGTLISKTAQSRAQIEKSMEIGIFKEKGYTSMEDLTKDITLLRENGIDPLELVRTKKDFSKAIVAEALSAKTG
ncbi:MAG: hypothetical protein PHU78_07395, partial [Heliobacteriaceae bacterium]|nr:hypothetical protein [Heliobacteriaceae bacterium]